MGGGAAPSPQPPSSFIISKKEINPTINRSTDQCGCQSGSLSSFSFLSFRSQKTPWGGGAAPSPATPLQLFLIIVSPYPTSTVYRLPPQPPIIISPYPTSTVYRPQPQPSSSFFDIIIQKFIASINHSTDQCVCLSGTLASISFLSFPSHINAMGGRCVLPTSTFSLLFFRNRYFLLTCLLKSLLSFYFSIVISTFSLLFYWNLYFLFTFLLKSLKSTFSLLFYCNLYVLFTFLLKSLLSLYFLLKSLLSLYLSVQISTFFLLFYWNLYFLFTFLLKFLFTFLLKSLRSLYFSIEISTFSVFFIKISTFSLPFCWNLYVLFTFLLKSLLSLYFSIEISTFSVQNIFFDLSIFLLITKFILFLTPIIFFLIPHPKTLPNQYCSNRKGQTTVCGCLDCQLRLGTVGKHLYHASETTGISLRLCSHPDWQILAGTNSSTALSSTSSRRRCM